MKAAKISLRSKLSESQVQRHFFGRIAHQRILEQSANSAKSEFATENARIDWEGTTHLTEIRRTRMFAPREDYVVIDLELQVQPQERAVKLDFKRGTPGEGRCFHSGLIIRFNNAMSRQALEC